MPLSAPLGRMIQRATAEPSSPVSPAPSLPGLEFASPGRREEPRGLLYQRLLDWGGDKVGKECRPGDWINLLYVWERSQWAT